MKRNEQCLYQEKLNDLWKNACNVRSIENCSLMKINASDLENIPDDLVNDFLDGKEAFWYFISEKNQYWFDPINYEERTDSEEDLILWHKAIDEQLEYEFENTYENIKEDSLKGQYHRIYCDTDFANGIIKRYSDVVYTVHQDLQNSNQPDQYILFSLLTSK